MHTSRLFSGSNGAASLETHFGATGLSLCSMKVLKFVLPQDLCMGYSLLGYQPPLLLAPLCLASLQICFLKNVTLSCLPLLLLVMCTINSGSLSLVCVHHQPGL